MMDINNSDDIIKDAVSYDVYGQILLNSSDYQALIIYYTGVDICHNLLSVIVLNLIDDVL